MNRQTLRKALEVDLRQYLMFQLKQVPETWTQVFRTDSTNRASFDDVTAAGVGPLSEIGEHGGLPYEDGAEGYTTTYAPIKYGKGVRFSEEMILQDQNRAVRRQMDGLKRSLIHTRESTHWSIFNLGFNSSYAGGDGKELFATDHPLIKGGTQANELSTAANLSQTSLEQAMIDLMTTLTDEGMQAMLRPKRLIVPPALWATADRLGMSAQEPDTANNAINPVKGAGFFSQAPLIVPYLTSTKAWYVLCDDAELWHIDGMKPKFGSENDFDTDDFRYKLKAMWTSGWTAPWGLFASPGV